MGLLLLWGDTMATIALKTFNNGGLYFQRFCSLSPQCNMVVCRQACTGKRAENDLHLDLQVTGSGRNVTLSKTLAKKTSESILTVTYTLQKDHTYSNKATPPNNANLYKLVGANYIQITSFHSLSQYHIVTI